MAIIDYGMGNLLSVRNAFQALGADVRIATRGAELADARAVVLPGVGAFAAGMHGLVERGFPEALDGVRRAGKPFLGICLGLQLLATEGTEGGVTAGLGFIEGRCTRLDIAPELRVPHIGWNDVVGKGPLFAGLAETTAFYFVHSYHLVPRHEEVVVGRTDYGGTFVSAIQKDAAFAVQFHPEKSHKSGLRLLQNFVDFASAA